MQSFKLKFLGVTILQGGQISHFPIDVWMGLTTVQRDCAACDKTKEIVMGPPSKTSHLAPLQFCAGHVERASSVKLLDINLDADFSWKSHEPITSKATRGLFFFLKQLRRACIPQDQLLHFYTGIIRPVLEYASPVWNHLLTKTQIDQLETIQRRALRIIYSYTNDMPCIYALHCDAIPSLADRREQLSCKFF